MRGLFVTLLSLFCLISSSLYIIGRSARMKADNITCCFAIEGYPIWNASRAISFHNDPYGDAVTEQNDFAFYGATSKLRGFEPQRFAYPIYATLPLLPVARLSFHSASRILLLFFAVLLSLWVGWLRGMWDKRTAIYTILIFFSYPVLYDLVSLQPTILFIAIAAGSFALFRSGSLAAAAALALLSFGKPQIALPIALPMIIVSVTGDRSRRRFVVYLAVFGAAVATVTEAIWPTWIREWLFAARAYAAYSPPPLLVAWLGHSARIGFIVVLSACATSLWLFRQSDLLFQVSVSTVFLYLLMPYRTYNAAILAIPLIWLLDNAAAVRSSGATSQIALATVRVAVIALWIFTTAGAVLLQFAGWHWEIGLLLPVVGLRVLFVALLVAMVLQCVAKVKTRNGYNPAVTAA